MKKIILIFSTSILFAQTQIDYNTQIKNKPITFGTSVPGSCTVTSNLFFNTSTGVLFACNSGTYNPITINVGPSALSYTYSGSGAIPITLQKWLDNQQANVISYGADPTGISNSSTAFNNCIVGAANLGGKCFVPCGTYQWTSGVTVAVLGATLEGQNGTCVIINYTPTTGTAFTLNPGINGPGFGFSTTVRNMRIIGPGSGTSVGAGLQVGGTQGCTGCKIENMDVEGFSIGLQLGNNSWNTLFLQDQWINNTTAMTNFGGITTAGEAINFYRNAFATTTTSTTTVAIDNGGQMDFVGCNFDQAKLVMDGTGGALVVRIHGGHFENPNQPSGFYDFVTTQGTGGIVAELYGVDFLDDSGSAGGTRSEIFLHQAGKLAIFGGSAFLGGPAQWVHEVTLAGGAELERFGWNSFSGNITSGSIGGSTTGYVTNAPGASAGGTATIPTSTYTSTQSFDVTGLNVSGNNGTLRTNGGNIFAAGGFVSPSIAASLDTPGNSLNQMGLGINCISNGSTSWIFTGDGTSNGGSCILGSDLGTMFFYSVPTTGTTTQTISATTLSNDKILQMGNSASPPFEVFTASQFQGPIVFNGNMTTGAGVSLVLGGALTTGTNTLTINGVGGPIWQAASGTPTGACVNGSIYTNISGALGTFLYGCYAGAWHAASTP